MIAVLILAAGSGVRFGGGQSPKQFCEINGKPIYVHSIATYAEIPEIDRIVLTSRPEYMDRIHEDLVRFDFVSKVAVVAGGETRQASVANGAVALGDHGDLERSDMVIVHNAASPNTRKEFVRQCIDAIEGYDAVQACVPDTRTVFERANEMVARVLPRAPLVYNCDPLIYRGDVFAAVLDAQRQKGTAGETTSDTALELGFRIRLVESTYDNIKVTTRWDLAAVRDAMENI